jgi:hypothetical protein
MKRYVLRTLKKSLADFILIYKCLSLLIEVKIGKVNQSQKQRSATYECLRLGADYYSTKEADLYKHNIHKERLYYEK